jgi:hypothetical protein
VADVRAEKPCGSFQDARYKHELSYNLAEQPLPRQREVMRTYGVRFHTREGDPKQVPAPQPEMEEGELVLA